MKWLVSLLLVACSTRSTPDIGNGVPLPATPVVEPAITAAHGGAIELLAITDDGGAVVSQDGGGGTRLWPTLDGTHEPIVVHIVAARQLAIGRDPRGLVIAALDEGHGVELVHVTPTGELIEHARIAPDPLIEAIAMSTQNLVALRADQTLAIYSATGELSARLAAAPGSRMQRLLSRNGHTLVLSTHGHELRGRWLAGTTWGSETPPLKVEPSMVAMLSPSGQYIAVDFERATFVLDTETGRVVASYTDTVPIGFVDDDTLIYEKNSMLVWQSIGDKYGSKHIEVDGPRGSFPFVVGDGIAVQPSAGSLVLHSRDRVAELGYALDDASAIRTHGDYAILLAAGKSAIVLDRDLAMIRTVTLPDEPHVLHDVAPLDDKLAIAAQPFADGSCCALSVIDLHSGQVAQAFHHPMYGSEIRFAPATGLLAFNDYLTSYLVDWNPTRKRFETWYTLAGESADVRLVDPQVADGVAAIAVRRSGGRKLEIAEIERADLKIGARIEPRHHYFVTGSAVDVDARGTVYVDERGTFVGYRHGIEVLRIADHRSSRLRVHPAGTYIALQTDGTLRLYDSAGGLRWETVAPLVQDFAWLGDDLVVDYVGGVGKIDAGSGALIKRVCGWSFGLGALPINDLLAGESICDAQ
jgi:hypothetical protein